MHEERFQFNRGAIRPMQCLSEGWQLIKSEYWFFLGVTLVGLLLAELAPLGILMGPALCGIHICLLRQSNGQRVTFDMLFQGFNYFGPGFIATLLIMAPVLFIVLFYYASLIAGGIGVAAWAEKQPPGPQREETLGWILLGGFGGLTLLLIFAIAVLQALYIFVFPLIVDRELTGWEAVTTSFRAVFANLGGVFAIILLETVIGFIGVLACYVGAIFTIPLTFAMTAVAYRQVFPHLNPYADTPIEPAPPAPMLVEPSTNVQSSEPRPASYQERPPESPGSAYP